MAMSGFDSDQIIHDLAAAATPMARFDVLTAGLGELGLNTINYGFFDPCAAELSDEPIQFLTTMSDDWMRYYYDQSLAETDVHVIRVKERKITPYIWGERNIERLEVKSERRTAQEGKDAGLRSALLVPLTSLFDPFTPVGGMALGSSLDDAAFKDVVREHGSSLVTIAHLFHNATIHQLWHDQDGGKVLSLRERDCLRYLADGKRQDAIADAMGLARVTVEMHLRSARKKLHSATLHEAIAKALVLGEIRRE